MLPAANNVTSATRGRFTIPLPSPGIASDSSMTFSPPLHSGASTSRRINGNNPFDDDDDIRRNEIGTGNEREEDLDGAFNDVAVNLRKRTSIDTVDYPRRRATIACDVCRSRKSRCDGGKPKCRLCTELGATCEYRERSMRLDAGDKLILEHLSRIEQLLYTNLPTSNASNSTVSVAPNTHSPAVSSSTMASGGVEEIVNRSDSAASHPGSGTWNRQEANISTMPKTHTTPALHLLQWPIIRDLVSKPYDPQNLLQLEMSREPLNLPTSLSLDLSNTETYVSAFFSQANQFYACVNPHTWSSHYRTALSRGLREGPESCIVLLVLALGSASLRGSISTLSPGEEIPGISYFGAAWTLLPGLVTRTDILAAQCMILSSAYLFYLVRPLDAWSLLGGVSLKLQLLFGAPGRLAPEAGQLSKRVYWNTLLFESDLLAELDLPHSGIVQFEESMGLPSEFKDESSQSPMNSPQGEIPGRDELWYFLAEIALRRLLNRVSHLIYAKGDANSSTKKSISSLGPLVSELDYQLTQWFEGLPASLQFPHEHIPHDNPVQTVLRFRYFACRTIIYRPYVLAVLENETILHSDPTVQDNCRKCLDACLRQIEDPKAHQAGHLPYLWQGALSIVSQSLLVMAASMSPALAPLLPEVAVLDSIFTAVIIEIGSYTRLSPSLSLAAEIVRDAEARRQRFMGNWE